ncbi:CAP domain-containing protein [Sporolactobacillus pectinivorans]|uniref:CAP domain-containing protein n=1 Tax=Sporolactobacillus pectinivorans TaxID=1591408 RepID=UPI000C260E65|nr:CAP domain-containing protein [Sporolactobacillus pectinivorans]
MHFFKLLFSAFIVLSVSFASVLFLNGSQAQANFGSPSTLIKTAVPRNPVTRDVEGKTVNRHYVRRTAKTSAKKRVASKKISYKKVVKKVASKAPKKKAVVHKAVKKPVSKRVVLKAAPEARPNSSAHFNASVEQQIVSLINKQRTSRGLHLLQVRSDLINFSRQWSLQQYDNGRMSHGMLGFSFNTVGGQNVAYAEGNVSYFGWNQIWSASATVDAWMHSPEHRANILKPSYKYTGVGVVYGQKAANGWVFFTQDFAN